jgi:hypothetical protein
VCSGKHSSSNNEKFNKFSFVQAWAYGKKGLGAEQGLEQGLEQRLQAEKGSRKKGLGAATVGASWLRQLALLGRLPLLTAISEHW